MNTYYNFAVLSIALLSSIAISIKLLKLKNENSKSLFFDLNAISLLIANAALWVIPLVLTPDYSFVKYEKTGLLLAALLAVILPVLELKSKNFRFMPLVYMLGALAVIYFGFNLLPSEAIILAIFCGIFTYIFDAFNKHQCKIATCGLITVIGGIAFLNIFFPSSFAIIFLALISGVLLITFYMVTKNEFINLQISKPSLHGFSFLASLFLVYFITLESTVLDNLAIGVIIPMYFIVEHVVYYSTIAFKKIFKKTTPTKYFYEVAIERGANYQALRKYIITMLVLFVMMGAIFNPKIYLLLIGGSIFISIKMLYDLSRWGIKPPTMRETFKQTIADAKAASTQIKNNIKGIGSGKKDNNETDQKKDI